MQAHGTIKNTALPNGGVLYAISMITTTWRHEFDQKKLLKHNVSEIGQLLIFIKFLQPILLAANYI